MRIMSMRDWEALMRTPKIKGIKERMEEKGGLEEVRDEVRSE